MTGELYYTHAHESGKITHNTYTQISKLFTNNNVKNVSITKYTILARELRLLSMKSS